MSIGMGMVLEQRLTHKPHTPLNNPNITYEAENLIEDLDDPKVLITDILAQGKLTKHEKMVQAEALLLSKWKYKNKWENYLDAPLISHAQSAISLKDIYDAIVGIQKAGIPYAKIFEMMGFSFYEIDFSHHKRKMEEPIINKKQLEELKNKKNVLLTDIDFVTGKTLRKVTKYLRNQSVNANGAYIGLSRWPGIDSKKFHIGEDTVDFDKFWHGKFSGLSWLGSKIPYQKGILPYNLDVRSPNPSLDIRDDIGSKAARIIALYFKNSNEKK